MKNFTFLLIFGIIFSVSAQKEDTKPSANRTQVSLETILKNNTADFVVTHEHTSRTSGIHHQYIRQAYNGLEIYGTESSMHYGKTGETLLSHSKFVSINEVSVNNNTNGIGEQQAIRSVASQMGYRLTSLASVPVKTNDKTKKFSAPSISSVEIPVKKMYYYQEGKVIQLIYELSIADITSSDWYNFRVNATTGQIIDKDNWTAECNMTEAHNEHFHNNTASKNSIKKISENNTIATVRTKEESMANTMLAGSYNVYAIPTISPDHGGRSLVMNPDNATASPFGWHDTNGVAGAEFTNTRGNNVYAQDDINGNNGTDGYTPDGGAVLNFDFPINLALNPNQNLDPIITNLFYWNNIVHDVTYLYGFDEESGNFQEYNYTALGIGGDSVNADAQDVGNCNANFSTPSDGNNPRMQMYTCINASPAQDSSLDNPVIVHEYAHGISNRLTGGAANTGCLSNSEQMGEGWSDIYGLLLTMQTGDLGTDSRPVGTYLFGQPVTGPGIRTFPYDIDLADNPQTYDDIKGTTSPHAVGEVWAMMLWEMTWELIDDHGYSTDSYNNTGSEGNIVALSLITEGLKLQPCSPGFVDGRDAILAADMALYGGANICSIWDAFAKRGLGFSADQGSTSDRNDGTEAFDLPPSFGMFSPVDEICLADGIQTTLGGGTPEGGEYSGTGATDNGDGITYTFDPSVTGAGSATIVYTVVDICTGLLTPYSETIEVTDTPPVITCFGSGTQTETETSTQNTPLVIPDVDTNGVTSTIMITEDFTITDLDLNLDITHTYLGDLEVRLTSPDNTTIIIIQDNCFSNDDVLAVFDDEATATVAAACSTSVPSLEGNIIPNELLAAFDGESTMGTWTLFVSDDAGQDTGTVNSWGLTYSHDVDLTPVDVTLDPSGTKTIDVEDLVYDVDVDCGGYTVTNTDTGLPTVTFLVSDVGLKNVNITVANDVGTSSTCVGVSNVMLSTLTANVEVFSGDLIITDIDDRNDDITIIIDGLNYRVTDTVNGLIAGVGATQDGPNSVLVPIASITGEIIVNTMDGDDNFTTDFSGGNFTDAITYNGGGQTSAPGDILILSGGATFTGVTHTFVNANDGSIEVSGNNSITYTGLEPIVDNLSATDRIFNFTGGTETIALDDGGTLQNQIDSTLGESVDFNNPIGSLTINTEVSGGTGADSINIEGLNAGFDADLLVDSGNDDTVNFLLNPTAIASGNLTVTTGILNISENITTTGNIDLTSERNTTVNNNATLAISDGSITMLAGTTPVIGDIYNGILLEDGNLTATTGSITLTGTGSNDGTTSGAQGVYIIGNSLIGTTEGAIDITGTGASSGIESQNGIRINDSATDTAKLFSVDGDITLDGTGGTGTSFLQTGVFIDGVNPIQLTGMGSLEIIGQGGTGASASYGVAIRHGAIMVADGGIILNGTSGTGSGNYQVGVAITSNALIEISGDGNLDVTGVGGTGTLQCTGISIQTSQIILADGNVTIDGTAGSGGGLLMIGVSIDFNSSIEVTGSGSVIIDAIGGAGTSDNSGFHLQTSSIATAGGGVTVMAEGGTGSDFNVGVNIWPDGMISDTMDGEILLMGTAGAGTGQYNTGVYQRGTIQTLDADITIIGQGNGTNNENHGINIFENALVQSTGDGDISFTGTGASGFQDNIGILMVGAAPRVLSNNGAITFNGFGGAAAVANSNEGVTLEDGATIAASGDGAISINGTGANAFSGNYGVFINGTTTSVSSNGGGISMTGIAGNGGGNNNMGIRVIGATITDLSTTATGAISLDGTGGSGSGSGWEVGVALFSNTSVSSNGGGISITGAGGSGSGDVVAGVFLQSNVSLTSTSGAISLTGTGGAGTGNFSNGIYIQGSAVATGSGNITLDGTGGTGDTVNEGILLDTASFNTTDGAIQMTGEAIDITGDYNEGIGMYANTLIETTNGAISLDGTSGAAAYPGIEIESTNGPITAGSTIIVTTNLGVLKTPEGIPATAVFEATNTSINGTISPGLSVVNAVTNTIGQAIVTGNFDLTAGSLEVEIDGIITPGTDYDQVVVNGVVDVTGATLMLVDNFAGTIPDMTELILIANDGTDPVVGTFAFSNVAGFNGQQLRIVYDGGDGNDVALAVGIPNVEVVAGDLIIIDNDDREDNITIVIEGLNYRVSDPDNELIAGAGATQDGPNDVLVTIASVIGEIFVDTMGADDNFTTDFSGGNFTDAITYNGGTQTTGDAMSLTGISPGGEFASVAHTFVNENDGNVVITNNSTITYTGLEPIIDNLEVANRIFNFTGGIENITLDTGGTLANQIDSTLGESVDFNNPTTSLTINTEVGSGTGADNISIEGVGAGFDANLTINGGNDDVVTFRTNPTTIGNGNLNVTGLGVYVFKDITTTGAGTISLTGEATVYMFSASLNAVDGDITLLGNGFNTAFSYNGISLDSAGIIQTTGSGNISLTGTGHSIINAFGNGVAADFSQIISSGTGTITLNGTGSTNGLDGNDGIEIKNGSIVTSNGADISLSGVAGGTGNDNYGIHMSSSGVVENLGTGSITLTGTGGDGANNNFGVFVNDIGTTITANDGGIDITGTGGMGSAALNAGVHVAGATIEEAGFGDITLNGTGGSGTNGSNGISMFGANTLIAANGGNIDFTGLGGTTTQDIASGMELMEGTISNSVFGAISLNGTGGTAGTDDASGIILEQININTTDGDISFTGEATDGTGGFNDGIRVLNSSIESTNGTIVYTGTSANTNYSGVNIFSAMVPAITGGTITVNSNVGGINTPVGIPTTAIFDATLTTVNGIMAPGQSPGQMSVNGNFAISSGDIYQWEIDDVNSAGTDYDQIVVNGAVDITDATLTLINNFVGTLTEADEFVIIDKDGTDAIVGTFDGLPSNTAIPFNGQFVFIHYDGGDGNDVVLVVDSTPTAICQDFTAQLDATGNVTILPSDVDGGSFDPDGPVTLSLDIDSFTCADVGTPVTVTLTVTDSTGNTATCTATVTVEDTITPLMNCPADISLGTDMPLCGATVHFADPIPVDNCGIASVIQTAGLPSGSVFPVGVSVVEYTATDVNGNTTPCSFTITVVDDDAPIAICMDITIQLDAAGTATIVPADVDGGSTDNCGIATRTLDIGTFTCANVGANNVTLTVSDAAGNSATCIAVVTVEDVTPPDVVCQDITVVLDATGTVTIDSSLLDGGSTDACGTANFTYIATPDTFTCIEVGENTVTLTVTDENGNSATCEATVTVVDDIAPTLVCQDITVQLDENGMVSIEAADVIASLEDACGIDTTELDIEDFSCEDIGTPVVVNVFANDVNGNIVTCTATVTVVDELAPVLTCPADQTVEINNGTQYTVPDYFATGEAIAIDNCTDPVTITSQDPAVGTMLNPGTYTVTITAEDAFGNEASCTFELTVDELLGMANTGFDIASLTMYPNPATNLVLLSNPQNIPLKDVSIYDVMGRLIKKLDASQVISEMRIDTSQLASATYMILINTEAGHLIKQLVKE